MAPFEEATTSAVSAQDGDRLRADAFVIVERAGLLHRPGRGRTTFPLDPVPRVLPGAEWDELKVGLAQRVKALSAFVADAYGARRIVQAGVLPARVIETAEHFEPQMRGIEPPGGMWVGIAGLDLVRDPSGEFLVLEDNVMTPSGFGYAAAAREAVTGALELVDGERPRSYDEVPDLLSGALHAAAAGDGDPYLIVLTEGPENGAYWEHSWAAHRIGVPLVTPQELRRDGDVLRHGDHRVDGIYRRTDADTLHTEVGGLLAPAIRAGTVGVVNAFGSGVADDKLVHAYVEDMIRFYLGEEPRVRSVQTLDLARRDHLEQALDRFEELVIKPRAEAGGRGVMICAHADPADVEERREEVRADPDAVGGPTAGGHLHASDADRRRARPPARRPAPVRVHARPRPPARDARRPHALRGGRGRRRRQLDPERRVQGHVGARPLIGVTTSEVRRKQKAQPLPEGDRPQPEIVVGVVYTRAVEEAGGVPVVLPPLHGRDVTPLVEQLAGVCLSGGPDLDPAAYGADRHAKLGLVEPELDAFELAVVRRAEALGLPVLGICRGCQVLNVARGGTLHQHVPDVVDGSVAHRQTESGRETTHDIRIEPDSRLAEIVGREDLPVNAFHHQAVDRLGEGLRAVAWAPDGIVEGIEGDGDALYLGVQWHVETLVHLERHARLFEALVDAAGMRRRRAA